MGFFEIIAQYYQYFLRGTQTTIVVALFTVFFGAILGCAIALMRLSHVKPLQWFSKLYITIIRGTPMLVQLYIVYYQLDFIPYPQGTLFGVDMQRAIPCMIALSINSAAYIAEIIRAGIQAVDVGQTEAARSCGMTASQAMRYIILPQAVKNILPADVQQRHRRDSDLQPAAVLLYLGDYLPGAEYPARQGPEPI